jgi:hypothetical protein
MNARKKLEERIKLLETEIQVEKEQLKKDFEYGFSIASVVGTSASLGKDLALALGKKGGLKKWFRKLIKKSAISGIIALLQKFITKK